MNKRIQELVNNFADNIKANTGYDMTEYDPFLNEAEKFALLIMRECANAAYQSLYEDRIFDDSPHIIRTKVMDDIKKHFGFEE